MHRREAGTVMLGAIDLLIETPEEIVVVDHKSMPLRLDEEVARIEEFAGQLAAYAEVLEQEAGGRRVRTFVHQPIAGVVFELERAVLAESA